MGGLNSVFAKFKNDRSMIRCAKYEDLTCIIHIITRVKKRMLERGNPQWDSDYPGMKEYLKDIESRELYVEVDDEDRIRGFMCLNQDFPIEYRTVAWTTSLPCICIHRLAVDTTYNNQGIADTLFRFAEEYAREMGFKSIRLDTFGLNRAAQSLFIRTGYCFVGDIFMKGREMPYRCYEKELGE